MIFLLNNPITFQNWMNTICFFLLFALFVFVITKKFLIPLLLLRFYPGIIVKKKKAGLRPVSWSKDVDFIFNGAQCFQDVCININEKEILEGKANKQFCVLKSKDGFYLAYIDVTIFQLFGFRYLITLSDISPLIKKLGNTLGPVVLSDHTGEVIYAGDGHKSGSFFPSDLIGDHPGNGEWDYLDIVKGNWAKIAFVSNDLRKYWLTRPIKIDDAILVVWQGHKIEDLQEEINRLPFPAKTNLYGYQLDNKANNTLASGQVSNEMPLRGEVSWHHLNVSLPLTYGFITYEDRLSTQARQLETMITKLLAQRHPDPESFLNFHFPEILEVLHPIYLQVKRNNRVVKETGAPRVIKPNVGHMGITKGIYDYDFSDNSGAIHVKFQVDYPITGPVKRFLEFCLSGLLPLLHKTGNTKDDDIRTKISSGLAQMQKRMDEMCEGARLFHERLQKNLVDIDRINALKGFSGDLSEILKNTAWLKDFDIVFKEPDVTFDEDVDVLKAIIDIIWTKKDHEKSNIYPGLLPRDGQSFMVKTNAVLMEKALEIIIVQIFPMGKKTDLLDVTASEEKIAFSSGKNIAIQKAFDDIELEIKFVERMMEKSGLILQINGQKIILSRGSIIS